MQKRRDTILVLGGANYARPFVKHGKIRLQEPTYMTAGVVPLHDVKLIVFTGGSDVDPMLYGEAKNPKTRSHVTRDMNEQSLFDRALKLKIPCVGICRGAQFLTVMNGGSLVQHVNNHAISGTHKIHTNGGRTIDVTSTHHQMMNPSGLYSVIAWADGLSDVYEGGDSSVHMKQTKAGVKEPEVVYYDMSKSLAVQFHPEYMNSDTAGYKYFQELLEDYVLV